MDVLMPEMDGLTALQHLKNDPATAGIPVILLSARGHVILPDEAGTSGAALFLTKPFSPTQLLNEARPMNLPMQPSRGLKRAPSPQPSPGGRGCRVLPAATCLNPILPSRRDSFQPTPGSTLRNPRRIFSFSLREKAGMRAARSTPRARFMVPIRVQFLENAHEPRAEHLRFSHRPQDSLLRHRSHPSGGGQSRRLIADIESERIDFAFQYWAGLDGLLHRVGNQSPRCPPSSGLRAVDQEVLKAARQKHYSEVHLYVFSDHGMANCDELHLDLKARIDALARGMEQDYAVVYDSTMARFWFFNDQRPQLVTPNSASVPEGRIMPDEELERLHARFDDRYFGELIFLVREGVLIVPSHMGERPIRAMHGYHPTIPRVTPPC
jgi:CheY-like chemotaxis protein